MVGRGRPVDGYQVEPLGCLRGAGRRELCVWYVLCQRHIWLGASVLAVQGDGMGPEVRQHVEDAVEPEVGHFTLAVRFQRQTEMLQSEGERRGEGDEL